VRDRLVGSGHLNLVISKKLRQGNEDVSKKTRCRQGNADAENERKGKERKCRVSALEPCQQSIGTRIGSL
jgi:hypothetical protein